MILFLSKAIVYNFTNLKLGNSSHNKDGNYKTCWNKNNLAPNAAKTSPETIYVKFNEINYIYCSKNQISGSTLISASEHSFQVNSISNNLLTHFY